MVSVFFTCLLWISVVLLLLSFNLPATFVHGWSWGYFRTTGRQSRSWSLVAGSRNSRAGVRLLLVVGGFLAQSLGYPEAWIGLLVGRARAKFVPGQGLAFWSMIWVCRLQDCGFLASGACPWWVKEGPGPSGGKGCVLRQLQTHGVFRQPVCWWVAQLVTWPEVSYSFWGHGWVPGLTRGKIPQWHLPTPLCTW